MTHEPLRGGGADLALLALPGEEQLRSYLSGESPLPPVARLTGRRLLSVVPGRVSYELPASAWFAGPNGLLHSGLLVFLADAPLFAAVQSALPARTLCTTAEVSVTFLGEPPSATDRLTAEATLLHLDHVNGLSEVFIRDGADRLVAHGTSRCFVFPPFEADFDPRAQPWVDEIQTEDTPDPWQRPLPAATALSGATLSGLALLQAAASGDVPRPPVDQLTGIRIVSAMSGSVTFAMPASRWLSNELGQVFGGCLGLLAKSATAAAVQSVARAGTTYQALDIKVNYLRPVLPDGTDMEATATVVHTGQLAVASTVLTHQGKIVALATGSTRLRPRPRSS